MTDADLQELAERMLRRELEPLVGEPATPETMARARAAAALVLFNVKKELGLGRARVSADVRFRQDGTLQVGVKISEEA